MVCEYGIDHLRRVKRLEDVLKCGGICLRYLFLGSLTSTPCGIEAFARCLAGALVSVGSAVQPLAVTPTLRHGQELWQALTKSDTVVVNLPLVAWKHMVLSPALDLLVARIRGRRVIAILHEWVSLHWARRLSYLLYLPFTNVIVFSSPMVRDQFAVSWLGRLVSGIERALVPVPPNMRPPSKVTSTPLQQRLSEMRTRGTFILAQFGSIYAGKNSLYLLDVLHELRAQGKDAHCLFIGSYIIDANRTEEAFAAKAGALGLADHVTVTGYIAAENDIFAALQQVDVCLYGFEEGLTSRRASVLACLTAQVPVVATAPLRDDEFAHHPAYRQQIEQGSVRLIDRDATLADVADALTEAAADKHHRAPLDFDRCWRDAAMAVDVLKPAQPYVRVEEQGTR